MKAYGTNAIELHEQVPLRGTARSLSPGERVFYNGEEYTPTCEGELRLPRSSKGLEQTKAKLGVS